MKDLNSSHGRRKQIDKEDILDMLKREDEINRKRSVIVKSKILTYDITKSQDYKELLQYRDDLIKEFESSQAGDLRSSMGSQRSL